MHSTILFIFLTSSAFLIRTNQCRKITSVLESERVYLRNRALSYVRFLLAQRVDPLDQDLKTDKSVQELIKDEMGREELKAIYNSDSDFIKSASSKSSKEYYQYCKSLLFFAYQTLLSSGVVQKWPRYFYDQDASKIVVLSEAISLKSDVSAHDFGPPMPYIEKLYVLSEDQIMKEPADVFNQSVRWVPNTPKKLQNLDFYELNHVIPLSVLASFCKVFSALWNKIDNGKRRMLVGSFLRINALDMKHHTIAAGAQLGSDDFDDDPDKIENFLETEPKSEFSLKKNILWVPSNLYYGFKNRSKSAEGVFDKGAEVIIGKSLSKFAENIYNRILDLLDQVDYTAANAKDLKSKLDELERIAERIMSDDVLFVQIKNIFERLVIFGRTRDHPYQNNFAQWITDNRNGKWKLIYKEDQEYEDFNTDERLSIANEINKGCLNKPTMSPSIYDSDYIKLEDFELWSILTDDRDATFVFRDYFEKYPNRTTTTLTDLRNLVRDEVEDYYLDRRCGKKNLLCSKVNALCHYKIEDSFDLTYDKNGDFENQIYPKFDHQKRRFVSTISFKDWCRGMRFEKPKQLTTDSAVIHILTFNAAKPNGLNKNIYFELYDEYRKSASFGKVDFPGFVNTELQKFNTTASKILNQACKIYNEPSKQKDIKVKSLYDFADEFCQYPYIKHLVSIYYCIINKILFGLPRAWLISKTVIL